MEPEQDPPAGAADWTVELFDLAELRFKVSEKLGGFVWRKRLGHLTVEQLLHRGVIACVEQIDNLSSNHRVDGGFFGGNALRERLRSLVLGLPVIVIQREAEH